MQKTFKYKQPLLKLLFLNTQQGYTWWPLPVENFAEKDQVYVAIGHNTIILGFSFQRLKSIDNGH